VPTGTQLKAQPPQKINGFGDHFASPESTNSATVPASASAGEATIGNVIETPEHAGDFKRVVKRRYYEIEVTARTRKSPFTSSTNTVSFSSARTTNRLRWAVACVSNPDRAAARQMASFS
jgi:hypothetical protein